MTPSRGESLLTLDIITINYNNRRGLLETVQSLKYISTSAIVRKKILIDGFSSDLSDSDFAFLSQYYDEVVSERDLGIYDAMNKGLRLSDSSYVLMLNSGDCLLPHSSAALDVVFRSSSSMQIYAFPWSMNGHIYAPKSLLYLYLGNFCYCHQALILPRCISYDCSFKISGDLEHLLRCLQLGYKIKFINIPLSNYEGGGLSANRSLRKQFEKIKAVLLRTPLVLLPFSFLYNLALIFRLQNIFHFLIPLKVTSF